MSNAAVGVWQESSAGADSAWKMSFNLTWSRRWRPRDATSRRWRLHDHVSVRATQAQCCPHPVMKTRTVVRFRRERPPRNYTSIVDMWREWNQAYVDVDFPRLMVRYEDLLFNSQETTKEVCECAGGTMKASTLIRSRRGPRAARATATTRRGTTSRPSSSRTRVCGTLTLTDADVAYVLDHAGPLQKTLHYPRPYRGRRLFGEKRICQPDRIKWLNSVGLKTSGRPRAHRRRVRRRGGQRVLFSQPEEAAAAGPDLPGHPEGEPGAPGAPVRILN